MIKKYSIFRCYFKEKKLKTIMLYKTIIFHIDFIEHRWYNGICRMIYFLCEMEGAF